MVPPVYPTARRHRSKVHRSPRYSGLQVGKQKFKLVCQVTGSVESHIIYREINFQFIFNDHKSDLFEFSFLNYNNEQYTDPFLWK